MSDQKPYDSQELHEKLVGEEEELGSSGQNTKNTEDAKAKNIKLALDSLVDRLQKQSLSSSGSSRQAAAGKTQEDYKFWKTQPVPRIDQDIVDENCAIEADVPHDQIRKTPLDLPASLEWCLLDLQKDEELLELQTLLEENYVEDTGSSFRFLYSTELLKWALMPPGYVNEWHVGIRVKASGRLVAFIGGTPLVSRIYDCQKKMVEINFLCVHKKLRSKRLAPVLIKEVTRRVHLKGIFQAIYTSGTYLPKPITEASYHHRSINPKKLIECEFSYLRKNMTMARTIKLYKLPSKPEMEGFREMKPEDIAQVHALYEKFMKEMDYHQIMTLEDAKHFLMPCKGALESFVVEEKGEITAFVSFYTISNQVLNNPKHKEIKAAYLWFYYAESDKKLKELVNDALICARDSGHDVMNCVEILHNHVFLEDLKFRIGDGKLNFYLFNWKCPAVAKNKQGFVVI